jgi:predicted transcriptional regulator
MMAVVKKSAVLPIKLTPEMKGRLREAARIKDRSASWVARKYIQEGLDRDRIKEGGKSGG